MQTGGQAGDPGLGQVLALVDEGRVGSPGLSNTATWRLAIAREHSRGTGGAPFGVWRQEHSSYWPRPGLPTTTLVDTEVLDYAADQPDLTVPTYSPNQRGQLVRPWMPVREHYDHPGSPERLRRVHEMAHELGATAGQIALAWHLAGPTSRMRRPAGSDVFALDALPARRVAMIPVVGARTLAQLEESLGDLDVTLPEAYCAALDTAWRGGAKLPSGGCIGWMGVADRVTWESG